MIVTLVVISAITTKVERSILIDVDTTYVITFVSDFWQVGVSPITV